MKKLLGISLIAILTAGSAFAVDSVTPNTNVATTSYVQGAFNQLQEQVNDKQEKLMVGEAEVNSGVLTEIRPIETATDTDLVTEKAVRAAIDAAAGSDERIGEITSLNTDLQSSEGTTVVSAINKLDTKVGDMPEGGIQVAGFDEVHGDAQRVDNVVSAVESAARLAEGLDTIIGSGDLGGIVDEDENEAANLTEAVHLAYEKATAAETNAENFVADKLNAGADGYDINASSLQVQGVNVVTTTSAESATFTSDGPTTGFGDDVNTIGVALNDLGTRVKQMEGFVLALYGEYGNDSPTAYVKPNGNIVDSIE